MQIILTHNRQRAISINANSLRLLERIRLFAHRTIFIFYCRCNDRMVDIMFQEDCNTKLMQLAYGNIHVGQYMTKMPPKELLEQKLSLAIANARELLEQRKEE